MSGTTTTRIDENQSNSWAKEVTLADLRNRVGEQNTFLKRVLTKITGVQAEDVENIKTVNEALGKVGTSARRLAKVTSENADEIAEAKRDLKEKLGRRIDSVSRSMDSWGRGLGSSQSASAQFGRTLENAGHSISRSLSAIPVVGAAAGIAMVGITTATSMAIERIIQTRDVFGSMVQSGLMFNRNLLQFGADVRETGLTVGEFAQVAQQFNTALVLTGEQVFLRSVRNLGSTFDRFGMNIQQGTEFFAEYLDISRLSSTSYIRTQAEQEEAFRQNIVQQTALARLTGVSVRQQQQERRALAERTSMRMMAAQLAPDQKAIYDQLIGPLSAIFGPDGAAGILLQEFGKGATQAGAIAGMTAGPGLDIIRQAVQSRDASIVTGNLAQLTRSAAENINLGRLPPMMAEAGGLPAQYAEMALRLRDLYMMSQDPTRQQEFADIMAGRTTPLDRPSVAVMETTRSFQQAIGTLDSAFTRMSGSILESLTPALNRAADALGAVTPSQISGITDVITNAVLNPAALLATGVAGAGLAGYLGLRTIQGMRGASPPLPPPALPDTPDTAATPRSRLSTGVRVGGPMALITSVIEGFTTGDWARAAATGAGALAGGLLGSAVGTPVVGGVIGGTAGAEAGGRLYDWMRGTAEEPTPPAGPGAPQDEETPKFYNDVILSLQSGFDRLENRLALLDSRFVGPGADGSVTVIEKLGQIASNTGATANTLRQQL
jgi:hypothetical protein